jgi:hypothetical protein
VEIRDARLEGLTIDGVRVDLLLAQAQVAAAAGVSDPQARPGVLGQARDLFKLALELAEPLPLVGRLRRLIRV